MIPKNQKNLHKTARPYKTCRPTVEHITRTLTVEETRMVHNLTRYYYFKEEVTARSRSNLIAYAVMHLKLMMDLEPDKDRISQVLGPGLGNLFK